MRQGARWLGLLALPGFAFFLLHQGLWRLSPTHLGWVMEGDWAQHVLGWLLFRNQPWRFPLGALPGVAWPLGTTVGFTDSNPWVSLLLKPFSGLLPTDFQFIGLWFALCFTLQGVFAGLLVREMTASRAQQLLGACLFVVAPILHARMGHDTLCAHFTLLALFWLHFRPCQGAHEAHRLLGWALGLVVFTGGVHGYLNVMVLALALALLARLAWVDRALTGRGVASWALALVGAELGVLVLFGFVGAGIPAGSTGFGEISADLLTFINPAGRSRLFPFWALPRLKDEGMAYLGLGGLSLVAAALVSLRPLAATRAASSRGHRLLPLTVVSVLFFLYALATPVTVAGRPVLELGFLYRPLAPLTAALRASGRFTWPLHYLLLARALDVLVRGLARAPRLATALAAGALGLQAVDVNYELSLAPLPEGRWHFTDPRWALAQGHYAHLALVPAILHDGSWVGCPTPFPEPLYRAVDYEAYRLHVTTNSAYVSRLDLDKARAQCAAERARVEAGALDPATVYVLHPALARALWGTGRAACAALDGLPVCVAAGNNDPFRAALGG